MSLITTPSSLTTDAAAQATPDAPFPILVLPTNLLPRQHDLLAAVQASGEMADVTVARALSRDVRGAVPGHGRVLSQAVLLACHYDNVKVLDSILSHSQRDLVDVDAVGQDGFDALDAAIRSSSVACYERLMGSAST